MNVLSVKEMRDVEQTAMAHGVSGRSLMAAAGENAAETLWEMVERWPEKRRRRFVVLCGKGNNGGDGWVVARRLHELGQAVLVVSLATALNGQDAAWHASQLPADCPRIVVPYGLPEKTLRPGDVVIDAMLGIGVQGAVRGIVADTINKVKESGLPVVSLDVPSGIDADTGDGDGAMPADITITMGYPKTGLFKGAGKLLCGQLRLVDIGLPPAAVLPRRSPEAFFLQDARGILKRRPADGHKNLFGHLLCLCNSSLYSGAGYLCATAALRAGAGLVTLVTPQTSPSRDCLKALITRKAGTGEAFDETSLDDIQGLLTGKTAVVYGPGTGPKASPLVLAELLASGLPMVIDADGLRLLAANPKLLDGNAIRPVVLTPHPGEMRVLQNCFNAETAAELAQKTGCIVVLKGRFTQVASPTGELSYNTSGDVSLATAGSGDVLSGVIGALLAEGYSAWDAARLGTFIHGLAAELRHGAARSLVADDLPELLSEAFLEF